MIVNKHPRGWEIIFQRAHGLLAAEIAAQWRHAVRPRRWTETLAAIAQHDNEQTGWEGRRWLTEAGTPRDFRDPQPFSLDQPRRIASASLYQGRWIALLTSMHLSFLYGSLKAEGEEVTAFIREQEMRQKRWRKALSVSREEAERAYALMQWCDRLSLILCCRELPDAERLLEIGKGPDGTGYGVRLRAGGTVAVEPWPFEAEAFDLSVDAFYPEQITFRDDAELRAVLEAAPIEALTWRLSK